MSRVVSPLLAAVALLVTGCVTLVPYEEAVTQIPTGEFLELGGSRVHVQSAGLETGGSPVVLVHGFGASSFSWRHVMPALAEHHPVVAVDLFGFGLTSRPREKSSYSRTAQVELLSELLDRLGWDSAHFVGHSYGGGLVMSLAHTEPAKVRSLVLVGSTSPEYGDTRRKPFVVRPVASVFVRTLLRPGFVRRSLTRSFYDDEAVTDELVTSYLERVRIEGAVRAYAGLTGPAPRDARFADLSYEEIAQPTLLVWGSDDVLITVAEGRAAAEQMPRATFVEIDDCGHLPMEERPDRLVAEVLPFLADLDSGAHGRTSVSAASR